MPRRKRSPKTPGPLPGQLSLFAQFEAAETVAQRRERIKRDERVRAVKACFGWWNGRGRGMA